jgi:quercetin dioxygenase-like cupin family protein
MKVIGGYLEVEPREEVPGAVMREVVTAEDGAPNFTMRVFEVSPGSQTPFHSHPWEHEVYVISGKGVVKGKQGEIEIGAESVVFIPADEYHCFVPTGDEALRFVCVIPNQGFCSVKPEGEES